MLISAVNYQPAVLQVQLDIANWNACKAAVESSEQQVPYKLTQNMMCAGGGLGHDACGVSSETYTNTHIILWEEV